SETLKTFKDLEVVIDRIAVKKGKKENEERIADSVQTAFFEGGGNCKVKVFNKDKSTVDLNFSNRYELDGMLFEEPSV
ncbi:MAG: hypothetical protein ACPGLV_10830, partial [Bacteroidia bacterium]